MLKRIPAIGLYTVLIYMPLHIFLSQSLSLATGGLDIWKIAKDVVLFVLVVITVLLMYLQKKDDRSFRVFTGLTAAYAATHLVMWALHPNIYTQSALIGTIYNTRLVGFLLLGYGAVKLAPDLLTRNKVITVMLVMSTIVATLGVIQYFLPADILTNVGYSIERGVKPSFAIDDKADLPRIMSTLRDPNSLGAYLLLPITFLLISVSQKNKNRMMYAGMLGIHLLALFLTFSRAAWAGLGIVALILLFTKGRMYLAKHKEVLIGLIVGFVVVTGLLVVVRDNYVVENIIFHSDENTTAELDSNERHLQYALGGIGTIVSDPLGYGPGTAGIVSINNPGGGLLTENYYVQIAHEVSIIGLAVFVAIVAYVLHQLLKQKELLSYELVVTMAAYIAMGFVMHLWSNEAVAAQWWLLAGAALAVNNPKS